MKYFKNLILWILIILYLEFIFAFFTYDIFYRTNIINIVLLTLFISTILSLITSLFPNKVNNAIKYILLFIFGFYFSVQYVFNSVFDSYFSFSVLSLSDQLNSFANEAISAIIHNIPIILLFFMPLIINIIFIRKFSLIRINLKSCFITFVCLIISFLSLFLNIYIQKNDNNSIYDLLFNVNENSLNIEKMGILTSVVLDIHRSVFGFDVKINYVLEEPVEEIEYGYNTLELNFNKDSNNSNIKVINDYMKSLSGSNKNKYTGMFEGYNLIYITAESFSEIAVSEELTPTLYKLINSGFVFKNFYTPNNLSTIGGEFQTLTGLYANNTILSKWRSGTNYFPYGLSTVFENINYSTYAYHNNSYNFQDRHKYLKSLGFDNYKGCWNGLEKLINCRVWPQSDTEMFDATISDYAESNTPFMAYYMTVSGHFDYNFVDNYMAYKHKALVDDLNYSTAVKAYVATQIELDRALESLINKLEEYGLLDKTVIVLQADHYPYDLSLKDINSISTYERDGVVEINHNSLIIWNNKIEKTIVEKTCMAPDVIPTIYNLFGIEYDSRLFIGNDIFSDKEGLAILSNRSWVTDYGTYFANGSKFVSNGKEVSENYVDNINNIVANRMNISKLIVSTNYYDYLFN